MEKRFRSSNLIVLLVVVLAIAVAVVFAAHHSGEVDTDRPAIGELAAEATAEPTDAAESTAEPTAEPADAAESTAQPTETADPAGRATDAAAEPTLPPAQAYMIVYVGTGMYEPIPLRGSARFTVKTNGGANVNTIEVNETSVWMAESTCPTQDCVNQGVVSLENKDTRILGDCIYCMAHNVTLQLIDAEQYAQLMEEMADE